MNQPPRVQIPDTTNSFDPALNPKNAKQNGYEYIGDIIYNECMPQSTIKDILELINKHGHKLGSPSESKEVNIYRGLYMPISKIKN